MNKTFLLILLALALSGCHNYKNGNSADRFDNNSNLKNDLEMYNDYENRNIPDCHTLCYDKIQEICVDEIVELYDSGDVLDNSFLNEETCSAMCNSEWTDDTRECIGNATKCDSLSQDEPYCQEEDDDSIVEYIEEGEINNSCKTACYKYKRCVMFGTDATLEDGNSAYTTCFEECQGWSQETIDCMNNTETGTASGCMKHTQCGLKEYQKIISDGLGEE